MMKKFHHTWTGYGKNEQYVCANWVHEDAVEAYKANIVAEYRARGWQKEFHFRENMEPCMTNENGTAHIFGVGPDGELGRYRVGR